MRVLSSMWLGWSLLAACGSAPSRPTNPAVTCDALDKATGVTDYLDVACRCGSQRACQLLAIEVQKQGGPENIRAAADARVKECGLESRAGCSQ